MGAFFLRSGSAHVDNIITKRCSKQSHGCPWQGCKATNHSVTLRNLPNPASSTYTPVHTATLPNLPEPASGTYNRTHWNWTCFRNLPPEPTPAHAGTLRNLPNPASSTHTPVHTATLRNLPEPASEPTPAHAGTLRNLPEPASGTYTSAHRNWTCLRNLPLEPAHTGTQPSGTCLQNLRQHTPELSGTFRNLPPEPTPAHTGTLHNLPGTCSCDPRRHTPELIWAEDPISLRCWGKNIRKFGPGKTSGEVSIACGTALRELATRFCVFGILNGHPDQDDPCGQNIHPRWFPDLAHSPQVVKLCSNAELRFPDQGRASCSKSDQFWPANLKYDEFMESLFCGRIFFIFYSFLHPQ